MRGFRRFDPGIALSLALAARVFARSPASIRRWSAAYSCVMQITSNAHYVSYRPSIKTPSGVTARIRQ